MSIFCRRPSGGAWANLFSAAHRAAQTRAICRLLIQKESWHAPESGLKSRFRWGRWINDIGRYRDVLRLGLVRIVVELFERFLAIFEDDSAAEYAISRFSAFCDLRRLGWERRIGRNDFFIWDFFGDFVPEINFRVTRRVGIKIRY